MRVEAIEQIFGGEIVVTLFHQPSNGKLRLYAHHIWRGLMVGILRAVRAADLSGKKLNHQRFRIPCTDADDHGEGADFLEWMEDCVREIGEDYEQKKKELYRSIGYEDGAGTGKFTIRFPTMDHLHCGLLGMSGLEVEDFEYTPSRFGIEDPSRKMLMPRGVLTISPNQMGTATIQIQQANGGMPLSFTGPAYALPLPHGSGVPGATRISAGILEFLLREDGTAAFTVSMQNDRQYSLADLEKFARLKDWMQRGTIHFTLLSRGTRIGKGHLTLAGSREEFDWGDLAKGASLWRGIEDYSAGAKTLFEAFKPLVIFSRAFCPGTLLIEGRPPVDIPDTTLFYSCSAICGDRTIFGMATRPFLNEEREESIQRLTFGTPTIVDMYIQQAHERNEAERRRDFESRLETMPEATLGLADLDLRAVDPGGEVYLQLHRPG